MGVRIPYAFQFVESRFPLQGGGFILPTMEIQTFATTSPEKTIQAMKEMVANFYTDTAPFAFLDLFQFYDMVKRMPYKMEAPQIRMQILQRPKFTFSRKVEVVACANKAIVISSFLTLLGIPNGFVISANRKEDNFGHVFNWAQFPGNPKKSIIDATYPENEIFREKQYPKRKVFE